MLITHLQLASKLRMSGAIPPLPLCLHGVDRDNFICMHDNTARYAVDIPAAAWRLGSSNLIGCSQWHSAAYTRFISACFKTASSWPGNVGTQTYQEGNGGDWAVTVQRDQMIWLGSFLSRSWKPLVSDPLDNVRRVVSFSSKGRFCS